MWSMQEGMQDVQWERLACKHIMRPHEHHARRQLLFWGMLKAIYKIVTWPSCMLSWPKTLFAQSGVSAFSRNTTLHNS